MSGEKRLPTTAGVFLLFVAVIADAAKFLLDLLFGIGFILDPCFISPVTWMIFWITLNHNGIPMMSGKRGAAGWINLIVAEVPGLDALPDWTAYTIYLIASNRVADVAQGIMS